ncbi:FFLEELY motif protein [Marinobacter salicampi]|uniref:FFLEELY motif protein n=1 Tax=Marinobacter salicampi TaxID=435907 RepID=UPI001408FEEF|nr:hypothetical protein [Marinobacter salicampi]
MYRERLVATPVTSDNARQLQHQLLAYHDFRQYRADHSLAPALAALGEWQAERLKATHEDLYEHPAYRPGLVFLLTDLYAPAGMTRRDDNVDRVFPKIVKWLPDHLLDTLAGLVELNHVTQRLDLDLIEQLDLMGLEPDRMDKDAYCEAFRAGDSGQRRRQIALVEQVGGQLDRYVRNRSLGWLLSMSRGPAEMAELEDLHSFIHRGYRAFRAMDRVDALIDEVVARETQVLEQILAAHPDPFKLTASPPRTS